MERIRAAHLGPERRRPQVLDAALSLAVERGMRAVSMDAVALRLGVTKPVVYSCFSSREELLVALISREEDKLLAGIVSAMPATMDLRKPEKLLVEGFQAFMVVVSTHADSWQLVFAADPDPLVAERYARGRQLVTQRVAELMRPGLVAGKVEEIDRKLPVLVELFMSMGDGAVRALLENKSEWTPQELGAFIGRLVFGSLQKA
jgi:AcrR family transcriptional regulator